MHRAGLEIKNIKKNQFGIYKLKAKTVAGEAECFTIVNLIGNFISYKILYLFKFDL